MTKVIPFDARMAAHRRIDTAGDRAVAVMARLDRPGQRCRGCRCSCGPSRADR